MSGQARQFFYYCFKIFIQLGLLHITVFARCAWEIYYSSLWGAMVKLNPKFKFYLLWKISIKMRSRNVLIDINFKEQMFRILNYFYRKNVCLVDRIPSTMILVSPCLWFKLSFGPLLAFPRDFLQASFSSYIDRP